MQSIANAGAPEIFDARSPEVSQHIKEKLAFMKLDVSDIDLRKSSPTMIFRAYLSLKRGTPKALRLAQQVIIGEIEEEFSFHPYASYWCYLGLKKNGERSWMLVLLPSAM
jgi:hypothetical protein